MELKKLNELLKNLEYPDAKKLKYVQKDSIRTPISEMGEGMQGDQNEWAVVYQVLGENDLYLKIYYYSDSYGGGEYISGVEFVKPTEKVVTVFETI